MRGGDLQRQSGEGVREISVTVEEILTIGNDGDVERDFVRRRRRRQHRRIAAVTMMKKALLAAQDATTRLVYGKEKPISKMSFYDCVDRKINGEEVKMSEFAGNVLLLVNVASKWGKTKVNYTQLPQLMDEFGPRGFKVLAFPCNQFGAQEQGTHEEILEFVKVFDPEMDKKLIFFEKSDVNGANAREPYTFLKKALPGSDGSSDIRWNFGKRTLVGLCVALCLGVTHVFIYCFYQKRESFLLITKEPL